MGTLLESLKRYFENTPEDILEKDWKDKEYLDEIGPYVMEYKEYYESENAKKKEEEIL